MSANKIRKALETRMATLSPAWDTVRDNTKGPVAGKTKYQRENVLFAQTTAAGLGTAGGEHWKGQYLITVAIKAATGAKEAEDRVAAIMAHFSKGLSLTADGVIVQLEQPYVGQSFSEPDWYFLPVWVPWFTYIT